MTEFWVCFSCCIAEQPQPKRRRRIDRSMIGEPTNFVHTTHVGSGDMGLGLSSYCRVSSKFQNLAPFGKTFFTNRDGAAAVCLSNAWPLILGGDDPHTLLIASHCHPESKRNFLLSLYYF
ncbi:CDC42 small effector protein 2-A [Liparis tanakae]|uniref:CDC42 small effector protein 2-A n=1 Tax=Liparis tanakae TaxID=230148 RepID=A0A4Z2GR51_9TELE|nr:CDC42 small effector protein 2-A [Liparis tanakae]